uniref:Calmin n=1 Tax=Riptortus pedestris TaxID=329032 RepID=R4WS22_RIPPE|nr:calmin [Riptortus pedestris]
MKEKEENKNKSEKSVISIETTVNRPTEKGEKSVTLKVSKKDKKKQKKLQIDSSDDKSLTSVDVQDNIVISENIERINTQDKLNPLKNENTELTIKQDITPQTPANEKDEKLKKIKAKRSKRKTRTGIDPEDDIGTTVKPPSEANDAHKVMASTEKTESLGEKSGGSIKTSSSGENECIPISIKKSESQSPDYINYELDNDGKPLMTFVQEITVEPGQLNLDSSEFGLSLPEKDNLSTFVLFKEMESTNYDSPVINENNEDKNYLTKTDNEFYFTEPLDESNVSKDTHGPEGPKEELMTEREQSHIRKEENFSKSSEMKITDSDVTKLNVSENSYGKVKVLEPFSDEFDIQEVHSLPSEIPQKSDKNKKPKKKIVVKVGPEPKQVKPSSEVVKCTVTVSSKSEPISTKSDSEVIVHLPEEEFHEVDEGKEPQAGTSKPKVDRERIETIDEKLYKPLVISDKPNDYQLEKGHDVIKVEQDSSHKLTIDSISGEDLSVTSTQLDDPSSKFLIQEISSTAVSIDTQNVTEVGQNQINNESPVSVGHSGKIPPEQILSKLNITPEDVRKSLENLHITHGASEVVEVGLDSEEPEKGFSVIDKTLEKYLKDEKPLDEISCHSNNYFGTTSEIPQFIHSDIPAPKEETSYYIEIKTSISSDDDKEPIVTVVEAPLPQLISSLSNEGGSVHVSFSNGDENASPGLPQETKYDINQAFVDAEIRGTQENITPLGGKQTTDLTEVQSMVSDRAPSEESRIPVTLTLPHAQKGLENDEMSQRSDTPRDPKKLFEESVKPKNETSENLIQTIKERIVNINTPSFVGLLSDLDNTTKRKEINHNLDLLKNTSEQERESIIVTTTILISEYLETITYIIINSKKYDMDNMNPEDRLREIARLIEEVEMLKEDIKNLKSGCGKHDLISALETQSDRVKGILDTTEASVSSKAKEKEETNNSSRKILDLISRLEDEIKQLESDPSKSAEIKLKKLDELDILNADYDSEVSSMLKKHPNQQELIKASQILVDNEEQLAALRTALLQSLALAQEYKDTLAELENVSEVAKAIVSSRVIVPSLRELQNEMQKERKFFVSLSHCRSILESLESSLDQGTRAATVELHNRLHKTASDVLESAGERAVALALGASRWTLLEQGLAEERGWLRVAQERIPNLSGVSSTDYYQYLSLYQSLKTDIELHSARVWKLLESAHTLQGLISCNGLEDSCDTLRTAMGLLEDRVTDGVKKLSEFKENWTSFEDSTHRLTKWLDVVIPSYPPPLDIQTYWELRAEYEVFKGVYHDACEKFNNSLIILPISDETAQKQKLEDLRTKWSLISNRLEEAEVSIPSDVTPVERLDLIEARLKQMEAAMNTSQNMSSDAELDLYIGKLQVLKEGAADVENELLRYSLGPACERRRLGSLQGRARTLKSQASSEHSAATSLRERLKGLRSGMSRAYRVQNRAIKILDQWEPSIDASEDVVRQALIHVKEVVKTLCDERVELSWLRETLGRLPISLRAKLSLECMEKEMMSLSDSHARLGKRAEDLLAEILSRLKLWDDYGMKLDSVRSTVREADYMMELLRVDVGPLDLPRIVKASTRLQGVKESLVEREGGLEELRCAGRALEEVVRAEVGERLRAEVREEEAAWARAEAGLGELAGRYQKAAKLWAKYREAVAAAQPPPLTEALSPQEWEKREEAVKEAKRLADEIAGETGVPDVLSQEVALLSRRLSEAKEISPPSPPSEPLTLALPLNKAQLLKTLQEKLSQAVEGNSSTEQLLSLRENLLELGKADAQLSCITDSCAPDNVSISDLLQLWEKVFRETFQEYHRLSSKLVKSEDSSSILNLWRDYLDHVNQFLESDLPQQYHELHEQNHLCQVHHTVLSSQRSLLPTEDTALDKDTLQQFSLLTNMHNETLAKIMEKQVEVQKRINFWDKYRQNQADLLDWLKKTENERNQLKLRYIHSKTIGKTIAKIEELLKKMSEGETMEMSLKEQLHFLLPFCDESVASSLQIEHASLSHRLSNLHAALLTWKDYLLKVKSNIESYENIVAQIQNSLEDIQHVLAVENKQFPELHGELEHKLQTVTAVSNQVKDLSKQVGALEEAKDILKDSLSPADIKSMTQRCWLFSQQQNEFEHQLSMAEQIISDKLQLSATYEQRYTRFLSWVSTLLSRLSYLPSDANSALALVERELRGEVSFKKGEFEWLTVTGKEIGRDDAVEKVQVSWTDLQETLNKTSTKLGKIAKNIPQLEEEMDNLRIWLHKIESKLSSPIILKHATKKYINGLVKEHQAIEEEIEKQSSKIKDVLNLCENLLNDCESCHITLDTEGITLAMANLEKRWKEICSNSSERKSTLLNLWPILEKAQSMAKEQKAWLGVLEKRVEDLEKQLRLSSLDELPNIESGILKLVADMKGGSSEGLSSLDSMYLSLHREYKLPDEMLKVPEELLKQWESLQSRAEALTVEARSRGTDRERWTRSAARAVSAMAKIDAILTLAEVHESTEQLQEIQKELENESSTLQEADLSGLEVMKWCSKGDVLKTQATIDEYQNLWKDINERLNKLKSVTVEPVVLKHSVQVEDQSVEVNTLKFETDQSTQVDTLGWSPPIARKEAFCEELYRTTQELEQLLVKLADLSHLETQAEISKCIGECESSYELAKHLSETLLDQCSASKEEALTEQVRRLGERFDSLRSRALSKQNQLRETSARGRLTCPLCSTKNWQQLDNDLWRLEQWLQYAEGSLRSQPSNPPSSIEQLEDVIQDQRELLLDLDSHRSLVVSMNIVGTHLAEHSEDEERAKELRTRLASANMQWERVCEFATTWQSKLQTALLQNEEFHDTVSELTEWLEKTESSIRQAEPIDLSDPTHLIQAKYNKFKEMREDVERCEARVRSLEEAARQVLNEDRVIERLGRLRLRLTSLSRLIATYIHRLAATLGQHPPSDLSTLDILSQQVLLDTAHSGSEQPTNGDEVDTSTLVRCHRFLGRVMRASVPISAFLLLLLGAASFIPVVEQDFTCANSFLYNMAPVLRYPNGRPPT